MVSVGREHLAGGQLVRDCVVMQCGWTCMWPMWADNTYIAGGPQSHGHNVVIMILHITAYLCGGIL